VSADDQRDQNDRKPSPPPGTPEYQEHYEQSGQDAMDATLAHPISRFVFGFFAIGLVCLWWVIVRDAITEYSLVWAALWIVGWTILLAPIIREVGSIAIFGRSRSLWFVGIARRGQSPMRDRR
jgi:hypothetical protein